VDLFILYLCVPEICAKPFEQVYLSIFVLHVCTGSDGLQILPFSVMTWIKFFNVRRAAAPIHSVSGEPIQQYFFFTALAPSRPISSWPMPGIIPLRHPEFSSTTGLRSDKSMYTLYYLPPLPGRRHCLSLGRLRSGELGPRLVPRPDALRG